MGGSEGRGNDCALEHSLPRLCSFYPQDYTLVHVPIEDQVYSLTDENGALAGSQNLI